MLRQGPGEPARRFGYACPVTQAPCCRCCARRGRNCRRRAPHRRRGETGFGDYKAIAATAQRWAGKGDSRRALQHHVYERHDRAAKGHRAYAFRPRNVFRAARAGFRMTPESRYLHAGSIVFNGAFVTMMPAFYLGGTYIVRASSSRGRDRHHRARTCDAHDAGAVADHRHPRLPGFVPRGSFARASCRSARRCCRSTRIAQRALPGRFYELYGLTEGSSPSSTATMRAKAARSAFRRRSARVRIVRDEDDAKPGEVGEIVGPRPT